MIELRHSSTVVHNYELGDCPKLEKILSVYDKATYSYTWSNYYYDESNKRLIIPRGFDVSYVQYLFPDKELMVNQVADESKTAIFKSIADPRNKIQENSIDFLLGEGQFREHRDQSQRMLNLGTGVGKTYCTITALSNIRKRVMVIVDQEKIMNQWKESFLKFTNLHEKEIYLISGSASMRKIMKSKSDLPYKVYIASHRTLSSYAGEDWSEITEFFNKVKIGAKVYDEAHVEYRNIFMIDSFTNTAHTFYLTATPSRSNQSEDGVYQNSFKFVPKYGLEEKFDNPYLYMYYISYNSNPPSKVVAKCQTSRGFDIKTYSDYVFNDIFDEFMEKIQKLVDMCLKQKGKVCIVVHKNDHVKKLAKTLEMIYPETEVGIFSSLVDKKVRAKELDKKIIVSTEKSMGKAVDVDMLRFFIMTVPTSSKVVADQASGRLREIPGMKSFYFDLTDVGFKKCREQRKYRRVVLDQKAKVIKHLEM